RVVVNRTTETSPGRQILPDDRVELDGKPVKPETTSQKLYFLLNKPRGFVCTAADPHAERKAVDLVPAPAGCRLFSAGRLDKDSEGMLIFSNDGDYVARLTHPRNNILKTYLVTVTCPLSDRELALIRHGIEDNGEFLRVESIEPTARPGRYLIVLNEGRKREIRRITAAAGAPTVALRRIRIGRLKLGDLAVGAARKLTPAEVAASLEN
ncbi:MAG: pseudouridine synthase, partial [Victivallaceae bacterium]|nr:pseudouridine synthase [Victivallaceae bacterium]